MSDLNQTPAREVAGQGASTSAEHSKLSSNAKEESTRDLEERVPDTAAREGAGHNAADSAEDSKLPINAKDESSRGHDWGSPDQVHPSGNEPNQSTNQTHAKEGGKASIVPQKLQEKLPESIERAVPNAIHDTGDTGGVHRKL
ncbi:hypothetical protein EDB81DRAFT_886417 [Dactylonectria macrodidyma]|uniref:Uncharacterized protein n=1 Tax=Dactylonectria macrodidyma TaxID=307937 RepID=A0A9P9EBK9_9HYPO|nr:hypothetical protein EDB81DRAFT_886417 [Dactylonectria macrodidyma]